MSRTLAQYPPLTGADPVAALHEQSAEIVSATAGLNLIVNQVFMLSVNAAGPIGAGGSIVSDPEGAVVADLPTAAPGLATFEIDFDDVTRVREAGTEGFNRMWSQMAPDDPLIDLPIYSRTHRPHPVATDLSTYPRRAGRHDG